MRRLLEHVTTLSAAALVCGAIGISASPSFGQCTSGWVAGTANSNTDGLIRWLKMWDPDGAGPLPPVLVASGDFANAGTASASKIATWDGSNWSPLGTGLDSPGYCLATLSSNNDLYVCGAGFTMAGGNPAKRIAQWDGSNWADLGTGSGNSPPLTLLTVLGINSDTIVISGAFTSVAGVPANRIAAWNTSTGWSALGDGLSSTTSATAVLHNGDVVAGGAALTTGGPATVTLNRIGRWDGTNWNPMDNGVDGLVRCMLVMPNGDLIIGGAFTHAGEVTANRVARWDGTVWSAVGAGMDVDVYALAAMPNGDIVAAGDFTTAGGNPALRIARWNGSTWSAMGTGLPAVVRALEVLPNGNLAVGGDFLTAGGQPASHFAIWSDQSPASINSQPTSVEAAVTGSAVFTVGASGSGLSYHWQQQDLLNLPDFIDINDGPVSDPFGNAFCFASGATTNQLTLNAFTGVAQIFRCVVSNSCGSVDSSEVTLSFHSNTCSNDFNGDGDVGTDSDIAAYFACLAGDCCATCGSADFNGDGDLGTDADIESFFRVLAGGPC